MGALRGRVGRQGDHRRVCPALGATQPPFQPLWGSAPLPQGPGLPDPGDALMRLRCSFRGGSPRKSTASGNPPQRSPGCLHFPRTAPALPAGLLCDEVLPDGAHTPASADPSVPVPGPPEVLEVPLSRAGQAMQPELPPRPSWGPELACPRAGPRPQYCDSQPHVSTQRSQEHLGAELPHLPHSRSPGHLPRSRCGSCSRRRS